jgi:peptidoglycan L-alanyl-D-glutamate endopeptidase CwlK
MTAKFRLGRKSQERMIGLLPKMVRVVCRADEILTATGQTDFMVLQSLRSTDEAYSNWGKGRTAAQCRAAGVPVQYAVPTASKVTWLKNPLASKHCKQRDGYAHAVDLVPYPVDWSDTAKFAAIAYAMQLAARELGVKIRWGKDWDGDGRVGERGETDGPHFEYVG